MRRALEQAAYTPTVTDYDPIYATDIALPVLPVAPWLLVGWGELSATPAKNVIPETLAFLGWRWTSSWRHLARPSALAVVWIPLPYILSHAESLSGPRLPLDGVLLCYAAFALCCLVPGFNRHLFRGPNAPADIAPEKPR